MKLVLAEKPSVAQNIAKVLGANERFDGYLEGNGYVVLLMENHEVRIFIGNISSNCYRKMTCQTFVGMT